MAGRLHGSARANSSRAPRGSIRSLGVDGTDRGIVGNFTG